MRLCFTATAVLFAFTCTVVHAVHPSRKGLADKHAPAGIMGDHLHQKGEWMVEYKYMVMSMEDNRIGETTVSDQDAIGPPGPPGGIVVDGIQTNGGATPGPTRTLGKLGWRGKAIDAILVSLTLCP